jgi:pilus assembly protein CpaB
MSIRTIAVVILALLCGVGVAMGVLESGRTHHGQADRTMETEPVLVTAARVERGAMLREEDVEVRSWPKGMVPAGALRTTDQALDRAATGVLMPGEIILDGKLSPKNSGRGLASLIPPGMRAFTVPATHLTTNVGGFILPGNKVDVLLSMKSARGDSAEGGKTTTLLQAVEVLAVDQILEAPADNRHDPKGLNSVTLLVTPEQAVLLQQGQNLGTLTFSLRNLADANEARIASTSVNDLHALGSATSDLTDGNQPSLSERLEELGNMASGNKPSTQDKAKGTIITFRGNQRGRVSLGLGEG